MTKIKNILAKLTLLCIGGASLLFPGKASAAGSVAINETTFPDDNLRAIVSEKCDTDGDGVLSEEEIKAVKELTIRSADIGDATGIEYFTSLQELYCQGNRMVHCEK